MSDDFLCIGYRAIAGAIKDHTGKSVFSIDQIKKRYAKELLADGKAFPMPINKGHRPQICAWFSDLKEFFKEKYGI
jgi:hypothetical protein